MTRDPHPPGTTLLHNTGVPPKCSIAHTGRGYGRRLLVRLPEGVSAESPAALLALLDGGSCALSASVAEKVLRARLDAHAVSLPIPPAAAVDAGTSAEAEPCSDLLTVLTILAKCSAYVYLRDKAPVLEAIRPGRSVLLILPLEATTAC